MRIRLHPAVETDLLEIVEYYEQTANSTVAADFYSEFRLYARKIAEMPESFPQFNKRLRRTNLHRFPHHILFEILPDHTIQILVIKHHSRHPSYGLNRR